MNPAIHTDVNIFNRV